MSFDKIHLRKLLKAFGSADGKLISLLREDIRQEIKKDKEEGIVAGGDFHSPFWSDAKNFVTEGADLKQLTNDRIAANPMRKRLYPKLYNGFMLWWNNKKRFSNEEIKTFPSPLKKRYEPSGISIEIKVENLLGLLVKGNEKRFIYPYFAEEPLLTDQYARLGLWLIGEAFPEYELEYFRIFDVIRSKSFSIEDYPLQGTEERDFRFSIERVLKMREDLYAEY